MSILIHNHVNQTQKKTNVHRIRTRRFFVLECVAVLIIVIAFFVISNCAFFSGDDFYMNYGVSSLFDVFEHTKMFYHVYGGRLFSVACQYLFCGVLGNNRIWFAIVNTLFFILLIMTCGKLICQNNKDLISHVLLFALLFWFLCPNPSQALFWVAASTTHLWANTLVFIFLFFFQRYKNDNFSVIGKLGLFFLAILSAAEFIPCVSICGAFVVYYLFHTKEFKGNAVPFVVGFVVGTLIMLLAPGNFNRAEIVNSPSILSKINYLLHHIIQEIVKYKALWIILIVLVLGWINNKDIVKTWIKKNSILLLSLGWSVVAFSVVFRPADRALFFTETLSIVLFMKFLLDNHGIIKIQFIGEFMKRNLSMVRGVTISLLFVLFMVDSAFAIVETKKMSAQNDKFLNEIVDSGGVVALDRIVPSHRMAYSSYFPSDWSWKPLADKYGLDSVHIYPFYCLEKYYHQDFPIENVYVDFNGDKFENTIPLIVRIKNEEFQESITPVSFTIDYTRPRKWYKSWLDKWRNYQYNRTVVVDIDKPECCFDGYCYYIIWFKRENAQNLKNVEYKIE